MNKKYISLALGAIASTTMVATTFAQDDATTNNTQKMMRFRDHQEDSRNRGPDNMMKMTRPIVSGTVTSITGNNITLLGHLGMANGSSTQTTYTVDATTAKIIKNNATTTLSSILVGDTLSVEGKLTGTTVVATVIRDGIFDGRGRGNMMKNNPANDLQLQGNGQPVLAGTVTGIGGTTLTLTNKSNVTYTVETATAKILVNGTSSTLTSIKVGDMVVVQGSINGTAITASLVIDSGTQKAMPSSSQIRERGQNNKGFFSHVGGFFSRMFGF